MDYMINNVEELDESIRQLIADRFGNINIRTHIHYNIYTIYFLGYELEITQLSRIPAEYLISFGDQAGFGWNKYRAYNQLQLYDIIDHLLQLHGPPPFDV